MIPSIRPSLQALLILLIASLALAHSVARNPLTRLATVRNPTVQTKNYRVNALSHFDLTFDAFDRRIRLSLEPNHDVIVPGATVQYLGPDGEVAREEAIDRLDHKVFKGAAWVQDGAGKWQNVGWARIFVRRDGVAPLFEGAFSINHNNHHVQMSSSYVGTRHELDPDLDWRHGEDEFMVVWRDSDISERSMHTELRRDLDALSCSSDKLGFNMDIEHPVYMGMMMKKQDTVWSTPLGSLFGKRQIDSSPGSGNSAGVNLVSTIGQTTGCPTTRKVALVGVATDCTYTNTFNSTESTRQNVITQLNTASSLYEKTFNISLGLQNLTVSDASCPGTPPTATPWNQQCSDSVNIQQRLNLFSAWRGTKQDDNSHWTLLTNCNTGSAVGLAWLGMACVNTAQTANTTDGSGQETVSGANVVAKTNTEWQVIAHETGHTFGAVHDCTSQTCSDGTVTAQQCCPLSSGTCDAGEKYIMNPSTADGITNFSPCSIGNICAAMGRNSVNTQCFSANKGVTTISGQQCGNGIVEEGEDCDCGGTDGCGNNPCCNPTTCKFKSNAVCDDSNEDCCRNCQFASNGTVCRGSTSSCDPQETCSGSSPTCPADVTTPDGQSCGNGLKCASGQCTSRDQQCKSVMGSYTSGNDTYACDSYTCSLSCASPEFGRGVCYGLQQNFLDGTTCGGGGTCQNGQCKGTNVGKEIKSWIDDHKPLVIGISSAVGALILLLILGCVYRCFKRRKARKAFARNKVVSNTSWVGGPPPAGARASRAAMQQAAPWGPPPPTYTQGRGGLMSGGNGGGWNGPPPPPMFQRGASVRYA